VEKVWATPLNTLASGDEQLQMNQKIKYRQLLQSKLKEEKQWRLGFLSLYFGLDDDWLLVGMLSLVCSFSFLALLKLILSSLSKWDTQRLY
jgi:hypothetical protein